MLCAAYVRREGAMTLQLYDDSDQYRGCPNCSRYDPNSVRVRLADPPEAVTLAAARG